MEGIAKPQSIPPTPTAPEWYMHMHTILQIQRSKAHAVVYLKRRLSFASPDMALDKVFSLPVPSLCIYLIGWRSRSRPMSPLSGQMTTESFDANTAISLGDLYLIIGPRAPEPAPRLITPLDVTPPNSGVFFNVHPPASGAGGPEPTRT